MDQQTNQSRQQPQIHRATHTHFGFGPNIRPTLSASRGETIRLDTKDCYQGLVTEDPATHHHMQNTRQIPVTGPVYVEGADIGDVLCVFIQQIKLADTGVFAIRPKTGVIGRDIQNQVVRVLPIKSNRLTLTNQISVPIRPVVGIIGVAPRHGEIETIYPGRHGGNMDTVEISAGSRVYLPVQVKGALLSIGDVKASMGDGQVAGSGVEAAAEITVRIDTLPGGRFSWPRVETKDAWVTITSASTVDQASRLAVSEMIRWLVQEKGLNFETAYSLVGISGDLRISQWNNPLITARIVFPKSIVQKIRSKTPSTGRPIFLTNLPDISNEIDAEQSEHSDDQAVAGANVEAQENEASDTDGAPPKSPARPPRRRRRRVSSSRRNAGQKTSTDTPAENEDGQKASSPDEAASTTPSSGEETGKSTGENITVEQNPPPVTKPEDSSTETEDKKPPAKRRPSRRRSSTRRPSAASGKRRAPRSSNDKKEDGAQQTPDEKPESSDDSV